MIDDLCDDERFDKLVGDGQKAVRSFGRSAGLFTSDTDDPNWSKAHNILLPNFSQQAMRDYVPMMNDIATQLMQKWERLNPGEPVDVTADMTRLTLDTIALCGFGYRFNSFYRDTMHPFVEAMYGVLGESSDDAPGRCPSRPSCGAALRRSWPRTTATWRAKFNRSSTSGAAAGTSKITRICSAACSPGWTSGPARSWSDDNIVAQCQTFLIAGHETTSGLLSFAISFLIKHPEVVARAQEEVDRVLGTDISLLPTYQQMQGLTYVNQILSETLRLWPTVSAFTRYPYEDAMVGPYLMPKGSSITGLTIMLHRDPSVWGADAEEFNPDHFRPRPGRRFRRTRSSRSVRVSGPASAASSPCRRRCWCSACCCSASSSSITSTTS